MFYILPSNTNATTTELHAMFTVITKTTGGVVIHPGKETTDLGKLRQNGYTAYVQSLKIITAYKGWIKMAHTCTCKKI